MTSPLTRADLGQRSHPSDPPRPAAPAAIFTAPAAIFTAPAAIFRAPVRFAPLSRTAEPDEGQDRQGVGEHVAAYGPRPDATRQGGPALIAALERSELTGQGGGHFPVATKWRTALAAGGGGTVVANCAEGEPASRKDAALLQRRPHLVLDGLALAAETLGTRRALIWLHEGDRATQSAVARAIAERREQSPLDVAFTVALGPDHYLTGESSAVVRGLNGGSALPSLPRQPAAVAGIGGRPTLVHNAETLAWVALVARTGVMTASPSTGSLVTVVGAGQLAVVEVAPGETFAELINRSSMASSRPAAVLVGGYGGSWLPWAEVAAAAVSDAGLRRLGASLGAGVIAPVAGGHCGLAETSRVLQFLAASSARQCGPCLFGLPALADLFARLSAGRCNEGDLRRLDRYAGQVIGRGACHHPDGAVRLVRSALRTFATDVRRHLADGPCAGAVRPALLPVPDIG
jgi:NADH:ubiquinone oxidoreductase subunit F (NADH-binding)